MAAPVKMRQDYSAAELRRLSGTVENTKQSRRLLALAAVLDGKSRTEAANIGGMDRQTLRDWVHRFNTEGPDGLKDHWNGSYDARLTLQQKAELAQIIKNGPDVEGATRWRRADLQRIISERFGVDYHERYVGTLLQTLSQPQETADPAHQETLHAAGK